jgi:hypothetical protein
MPENPLVDYFNKGKGYVQKYLDAVPDPKTMFQKKQASGQTKPFKFDGPKEKEEQRKASDAASKRKVGGSDGKSSTAQKQTATKKPAPRKRVAGKS